MKIQISLSDTQEDKHRKVLEETGFWGKQAAGCLFLAEDSKRIMLAHRSQHVQEPNTWGMWGGALDENETPLDGVRREIEEETLYNGELTLLKLSVFSHTSGFKYHNFLAVVPTEFKPRLDWENQGYEWVKFGAWPSPLHPGVAETLRLHSNLTILKKYL